MYFASLIVAVIVFGIIYGIIRYTSNREKSPKRPTRPGPSPDESGGTDGSKTE